MSTDLTKMVEEWYNHNLGLYKSITNILKALAAEIEANREEIEGLKRDRHSHKPPM